MVGSAHMFGHAVELVEGGVVLVAVVLAAVVLAAVVLGVAAADELVAAFAITAPPPAKAPVITSVASVIRKRERFLRI